MKNKILLLVVSIFIISTNIQAKEGKMSKILGGWFSYDQQLGGINNEFFTLGGITTGISFLGISLGLSVYGNFPFESDSLYAKSDYQYYYGGLVLGYKTPWKYVGARIFATLGMSSTDSKADGFKLYFVVAPSLYIDFHVYKSLTISLGVTYRYNHHYKETPAYLNDWKNALSGTVSIGWVH